MSIRWLLAVGLIAAVCYALSREQTADPVPSSPVPVVPLQLPRQPRAGGMPLIRVAVTPSPVKSLTLEVVGGYRLVATEGGRVLAQSATGLKPVTLAAGPRGIRLGTRELPVSQLEIIAERSPAIWVNDHQYRGTLRIVRRSGSRLQAVNVLPLEQYVASVVDSEMPIAFGTAARQAQAVVARSYAVYQMQQASSAAIADVAASTRSQKYLGYQYRTATGRRLAGESANSRQVVSDTRGLVCLYRGELFCTYYSAVCGGATLLGRELFSDAAAPLRSVPCEWCRNSPRYRWQVELSREAARAGVKRWAAAEGKSFGELRSLRQISPVGVGLLPVFEISDGTRQLRVTGGDLRQAWSAGGILSPQFRVTATRSGWTIAGQGHGHGVGLCQWGARGQGLAGRNFRAILGHYYPGSQLASLGY